MSPSARVREPLTGLEELVASLLEGKPRAVARAISWVESESEETGELGRRLIQRIYPHTGRARVVGVTGPAGAGKSTLVDRLARELRGRDLKVAILAVDPSSPFTGGALLGDRIRMQELFTDPGVFIRSMATRGAMGGLARATHDALDVLDAAGFDWILLETVGVGQDEVDVVRTVDTVVVLTVPGLGDDIQAIKAGLMEIADVFVLNKSDREGAAEARRSLLQLLEMMQNSPWVPPIVATVAPRGEGVEELVEEIERHRRWLVESGQLEERRRDHLQMRVEGILQQRFLAEARRQGLQRQVAQGFAQGENPYALAQQVLSAVMGGGSPKISEELDD